jgi:hypothetical protein
MRKGGQAKSLSPWTGQTVIVSPGRLQRLCVNHGGHSSASTVASGAVACSLHPLR